MKIAIMTDMEGVAGVINFKDWVEPQGRYYDLGKMLLTEEVNAAIRGLFDAGADEVVVIDGHGYGGINPILLDRRALYSRDWGRYHVYGLDDNFDAMIWIGQHAKAGTVQAHLAHTGMCDVYERRLNGISVGEYGEDGAVAGYFGTPTIFASGDRAFVAEAKALTPWVHAVEVKYGVTLDNGANCTTEEYEVHNLGAVHVHPEVARERIYKGAKAALEDFTANREKFKPFCPKPPYVFEQWIRRIGDKPAFKVVQRHDTDLIELFSAPVERYEEGTYELPY